MHICIKTAVSVLLSVEWSVIYPILIFSPSLICLSSTPTKVGIENLALDRNTESLFEELSSAGNDLIGDVDEGADLLGTWPLSEIILLWSCRIWPGFLNFF